MKFINKIVNLSILILFFGIELNLQSQNFSWAKAIGSAGNETIYSTVIDASGNVYACGYFDGSVDFDPGPGISNLTSVGSWDGFVCKFDMSGNFLWVKQIGGVDFDYIKAITLDGTSFYITGLFGSTVDFDPGPGILNLYSNGLSDMFVCKYDLNGNLIWAKGMGGINGELGTDVAVDISGNVYTTGHFTSPNVDFDPGPGNYLLSNLYIPFPDIFVSKLNSSGNFVWARRIGDSDVDIGSSITVDNAGNSYITGEFKSPVLDFNPGPSTYTIANNGMNDFYIVKLDPSSNFVWVKTIGGAGDDSGYSIALDISGNIYTTGVFTGNNVDFDPGLATHLLSSNSGSNDIFINKFDGNGNFIWAKQIGGSSTDYGQSVFADVGGNVYVTGCFQGTVDFDPGAGTYMLTSSGLADVYVSILDMNGNFYWTGQIGGSNNDLGWSILATPIGEIYTSGYFASANTDFDCGTGTYTLSSLGGTDAFIQKISGAPSGIKEGDKNETLLLYPQPTSNKLYFRNINSSYSIILLDVSGKIIPIVAGNNNEIDVSALPDGMYFLQIQTSQGALTRKIVVQH